MILFHQCLKKPEKTFRQAKKAKSADRDIHEVGTCKPRCRCDCDLCHESRARRSPFLFLFLLTTANRWEQEDRRSSFGSHPTGPSASSVRYREPHPHSCLPIPLSEGKRNVRFSEANQKSQQKPFFISLPFRSQPSETKPTTHDRQRRYLFCVLWEETNTAQRPPSPLIISTKQRPLISPSISAHATSHAASRLQN